eukprot:g33598.t1
MSADARWHRFVAGGLGEMFAVSFSHPADVLKVRLQLTGECDRRVKTLRVRDMMRVARQVAVLEGFGGLYGGISAAWLRMASFGTLRHGLYGLLEQTGRNQRGVLPASGEAGLLAGTAAALAANPADVVLIRMQADGGWPEHQRRALDEVYAEGGLAALYRGSGPTALRAALVTMSQLATYEEKAWRNQPSATLRA